MGRFAVPDSSSSSRFEVPDNSSSDEDGDEQLDPSYHTSSDESSNDSYVWVPELLDDPDSSDSSEGLPPVPDSPEQPPEIPKRLARKGRKVQFDPVTEDTNHDKDILKGTIRHKNIVNFYHVEADSAEAAEDGLEDPAYNHANPPAYIPHFTDIRTLKEILQQNRTPPGPPTSKAPAGLTEGMVWHVLLSLLKALSYLHSGQKVPTEESETVPGWMPIVHNSIRPENIIFEHPAAKKSKNLAFRFGACKLGNFTRCVVLPSADAISAETEQDLTDDERIAIIDRVELFGTIFHEGEAYGYEAPEILDEDAVVTEYPGPWSDLWSLGALGVEMMTGRSVWDLILEIEFEDHAQANYHHSVVQERWRHVSLERRHELLREFAGEARILNALPKLYSYGLRVLIEALLVHHQWDRGESQYVLLDAERRFEIWQQKGHRIFEKEAMDDLIGEVDDRALLFRIEEAKNFLDADLIKSTPSIFNTSKCFRISLL